MAVTNSFKAVPHNGKFIISKRGMIYDNIFDTKEEAEEFIKEASKAIIWNSKSKRWEKK